MIEEKDILEYLEGTASKKLSKKVEEWAQESPENKAELENMRMFWGETSNASTYVELDTDAEWDFFMENISAAEGSSDVSVENQNDIALDSLSKVVEPKPDVTKQKSDGAKVLELQRGKRWRTAFSVAASVAFIAAATFVLWPENKYHEIVNAPNDMELELEDGTIAYIKKGANLKTLKSYKYEEERIAEIDGEVTFDVASDPDKVFTVKLAETSIEVLGTKFNIKSEGVESEVANEEGQILFYVQEDKDKNVTLNPGDVIKYDGSGFIDMNPPAPPPPKVIPKVSDILGYLKKNSNGKVTFGSSINDHSLKELDIEYEGKNVFQIIQAMREQGAIVVTTSNVFGCASCIEIVEIIPRRK